MTPSARLAAAIDLLEQIDSSGRKPADAVANDFFRDRRFIGSGDRRAVSDRVWGVLRARRRLSWWLARAGAHPAARLLVAASLLLEGWTMEGRGAELLRRPVRPGAAGQPRRRDVLRPLAGRTLDHPSMSEPVRLEIPDWILPHLQARFGDDLAGEMAAMAEPAPLDLRVNLPQDPRCEAARAALLAEAIEAEPTPYSPWGLRVAHRRAVTSGAAFQTGAVEIQDEGSQLVAHLVGAAARHARGRLVRGRRRQDAGDRRHDGESRPHRRLRRERGAVGGGGQAPAPRRRAQRGTPSDDGRRQMGQAPRPDLRPGSG